MQHTLLGGINTIDFHAFDGDYEWVVITNNTVVGGFISESVEGSVTEGTSSYDAIIKYVEFIHFFIILNGSI